MANVRFLTSSYGTEKQGRPPRSKLMKQLKFKAINKPEKDKEFPQEIWEELSGRHDRDRKAVFGVAVFEEARVPAWVSFDRKQGKIVMIHPKSLNAPE